MKQNLLFEQKKVKLWNKQHFVENKAEIIHHVLKIMQISLLPKYIKSISWGVFLLVFVYANARIQAFKKR